MKNSKPFYIGWKENMPDKQRSFFKKLLIPIFILIPIVAFFMVRGQRPFNDHIFQLGQVEEYTGIYHSLPVPILEFEAGQLEDEISNYVLLVGFGKFGAEGILSAIENQHGSLINHKIILKGSLIYGDGKAVLELTKKENSLVKDLGVIETTDENMTDPIPFNFSGEILDPKCYFGVMKPGEGKIHKSCAIRCISGGIPPVFKARIEHGQHFYSILLGKNGEKINKEILNHVGELVLLNGETKSHNGWEVVYIDPQDVVRLD